MTGSRRFLSPKVIAGVLVIVALAPFVIAIAARAGRPYVPVGDFALMDLRTRDVWSSDIPLIGAYSRFGWNHPGPAAFYALAPLSGAFGTRAWATIVANAVVQGVVVVAVAAVAWRVRGLAGTLVALTAVGLAYGALGPAVILDPWNPHLAYPLFVLFILLAWVLALGKPRALTPLALVASGLVQLHVGYLPLVLAMGTGAIVFGVTATHARRRAWFRPLAWTAIALVVVWVPPVVQEIARDSNVRPLTADLFGGDDESPLGIETAARVLAEEFAVPPPWLGGEHELEPFGNTVVGAAPGWLLVPASLLVAGALASTRRRAPGTVELLALAVTGVAIGFVALVRVIGDPERYVFYWRVPLAILVVVASGWCIWTATGLDRRTGARRAAGIGLGAIIVAASVTTSVRLLQTDSVAPTERISRAAVTSARADTAGTARILVREADTPFIGVQRALVNEMDRAGDAVTVDRGAGFMFGAGRAGDTDDVDEVWYVSENGQYLSELAALPGARVVWNGSPLDPADEQQLQDDQRALWAVLSAIGREDLLVQLHSPLVGFALDGVPGLDPATVQRVADANAQVEQSGGCRCAIVAFPPEAAEAAAARIPPDA